jgi:hypothetical protein
VGEKNKDDFLWRLKLQESSREIAPTCVCEDSARSAIVKESFEDSGVKAQEEQR